MKFAGFAHLMAHVKPDPEKGIKKVSKKVAMKKMSKTKKAGPKGNPTPKKATGWKSKGKSSPKGRY